MSYLIAEPRIVAAAAAPGGGNPGFGSRGTSGAAAAGPTCALAAAAGDERCRPRNRSAHTAEYQAVLAQVEAFHS